jgi:hypothetical protein
MPEVKQLDWSKLLPDAPKFDYKASKEAVPYRQAKKKFKDYRRKTNFKSKTKHKAHKPKKIKPADKDLYREAYEQDQHIKAIMRGE